MMMNYQLSEFLLGLATSHAGLRGSLVLDFHHCWYSPNKQSSTFTTGIAKAVSPLTSIATRPGRVAHSPYLNTLLNLYPKVDK